MKDGPDTEQSSGTDAVSGSDTPQATGSGTRQATESGQSSASPEAYTTDRRSLTPRVRIHWAVRAGIGVFVFGGLFALVSSRLIDTPLPAVFLLGLGVVSVPVWVVLHYRRWVYQIRDDAIYLERGVFTHVRTLVPYVRIQHVDTSRSPLERLLGLSTLVVYTAGSRGADVSVPGLTPQQARDLQRRIKELAIEAEGEDAL